MSIVEIYCDGSISRATLEAAYESYWSNDSKCVGRIAIIMPDLDYGLIERFYDNLELPNGHENSQYAEEVAIRRANAVFKLKGLDLGQFVIYSDNPAAIQNVGLSYVEPVLQRFNFADEYLKKMLNRLAYFRASHEKVRKRHPLNKRQREIETLIRADREEFALSESALYRSFGIARRPKAWPK